MIGANMLFKNITVLKIIGDVPTDLEEIEGLLKKYKFSPAQGVEQEKVGWVNPVNDDDDDMLVRSLSGAVLFCLKVETKILPSSVINEELKQRLSLRGMNRGKARQKDVQRISDEIRFELLPKAFSRYSRVMGYVDLQRQELIIGTANGSQAENFQSLLRQSFGTLKVTGLAPEEDPKSRMTSWMKNLIAPDRVKFGEEISLEDPADGGGKGNFRKQDLRSDEIKECLDSGKLVHKLALQWNDYLSFVLDGSLVIRKIAPLEMFDQDFKGEDEDEDYATFDTDFFLTINGLRQLLPEVFSWFGVGTEDSEDHDLSDIFSQESDFDPHSAPDGSHLPFEITAEELLNGKGDDDDDGEINEAELNDNSDDNSNDSSDDNPDLDAKGYEDVEEES